MDRAKRFAVFVAVGWALYVAVSALYSLLFNDSFDVINALTVGFVFSAVMGWVSTVIGTAEDVNVTISKSELKEDLDWRNLDAVKQYLQDQHVDFQKAEVSTTSDGLTFRFSRLFGWQHYTITIAPSEDGLHLHGCNAEKVFNFDDYHMRVRVLSTRRLFSKQAA